MSRSLSALAAALVLLAAAPAHAEPLPGPVEDLIAPVEDLVGEVESLDGSESESKQGRTITVALTSDVLFALDKYALSGKARQRIAAVATKIKDESAGGVIRIAGHTDDQGSDDYNVSLSLKRAQAVSRVLRAALNGQPVSFEAKGYGEARPKLPNQVEGRAIESNRAKNRRVEIVFDAKE
ncbi:OmpA family protein [Nonomuraea sp. NBC_01738]|uniref:OmpA family protein n=1 Tax=Nonomuraea sp. NBC_01738 TaxID=2976003 RepID=UPI002E0D177C|nr:OmpA family protein [Nonomuraea sp. NBC_01738]